jgi:hypothetical protein
MIDDAEALRKIRRWAEFHIRGVTCEAELACAFLSTALEASLEVSDECLAALPESVRPALRAMLEEFAARDYFDDRHRYVSDGRTNEERELHYRRMRPHYRKIGEHILSRLRGDRGEA